MNTIIETAASDARFSTLVSAIETAGLTETLSGSGPFTVFAPTNDAFAKIPADTLTAVLADKEKLTVILKLHVVSSKLLSSELTGETEVSSLQGKNLSVTTEGGVSVGGAKVQTADIECSNGVIHAIDTVLMP